MPRRSASLEAQDPSVGRDRLCRPRPAQRGPAPAGAATTVAVNGSQTFQTIDGFGNEPIRQDARAGRALRGPASATLNGVSCAVV